MRALIVEESTTSYGFDAAIVLEMARGQTVLETPIRPLTEIDRARIKVAGDTEPYQGPVVTRADAREAGALFFFTGKPCKHGHLSVRLVSNGGCAGCGSARQKANPEASRLATAKWRARNIERCRARSLADYYAKQDYYLALQKQRRDADPEKFRAQTRASVAKWREANGQKNRDAVKAWRIANPERSKENRNSPARLTRISEPKGYSQRARTVPAT
jgi:hypothetical protein